MISKNGRRNTHFQIDHFLVGSCFTADGAYSLLCDLREERVDALAQVTVSELRTRAKIARAEAALRSEDEATRLDAEADLVEIRATADTLQKNIAAARGELAHIDGLIAKLQPHRRFSHLPDAEAHEAAQRDEWRLELANRAENFLLTSGSIPHDHFASMRQHPDFVTGILPVIEQTKMTLMEGRVDQLLTAPRPAFLALEAPDVCTD